MFTGFSKKKKNEKSKKIIKPVSLGREQQSKSKGKLLKIDENQFKKISNRQLLSSSVGPEDRKAAHNKSVVEYDSRPRKVSPGLKKKDKDKTKPSHIQSAVFKHDPVRKRDSNSVLDGKKSSKDRVGKPKRGRTTVAEMAGADYYPNYLTHANHRETKSGLTYYEIFPNEAIAIEISSSEILCSSNGESRDEPVSRPVMKSKRDSFKTLTKQEREELELRGFNFRRQNAAIKIQKTWRGFQTRLILERYLMGDFDRPEQKRGELRSNRLSSEQNHHLNVIDRYIDQESVQIRPSALSPEANVLLNFDHVRDLPQRRISPYNSSQDSFTDINYSKIEPGVMGFEPRSHPRQEDPQPENEEEDDGYYDDEDSNDDISDFPGFIRQRPIHNHEELNEQLRQLKREEEFMGKGQGSEDEYDYYDHYEPNEIIVETNEEHIESRKNSMQNRNRTRRLFESTQRRISSEDPNLIKTISEEAERHQGRHQGHQRRIFNNQILEKSLRDSQKRSIERHEEKSSIQATQKIDKNYKTVKHVEVAVGTDTSFRLDNRNISNPQHLGRSPPSIVFPQSNQKQFFKTIEMQEESFVENLYKNQLKSLKQEEAAKWNNIIEFIRREVELGHNNSIDILNNIILISETNKRELEADENGDEFVLPALIEQKRELKNELKQEPQQILPTQAISTEESGVPHPTDKFYEDKFSQLQSSVKKKRNLRLEIDDRNDRNSFSLNEPMVSKSKHSEFEITRKLEDIVSPFEESRQPLGRMIDLESVLMKNQGFNSGSVEAIMTLREDALEEREKAEHNKLYDLFQNKRISEEELNFMLAKLKKSSEDEREQIERNKKEIEKGLKAAAKVIAKAEKDASMVGKRIGVSKSAQSLRPFSKLNSFIILNKVGDEKEVPVFVDQGKQIHNPKPARNFFVNETDSNNSDQLDFTEEQYKSFSRPNLSNEFVELNRNIIITQEFLRGEKDTENYAIEIPEQKHKDTDPRIEEYVNKVTEMITTRMMHEAAIEYYKSALIFETVHSRIKALSVGRRKVSRADINQFIEYISTHLPHNSVLVERLNQKICPPPLELLKCMRVDLYPIDYDQDQNMDDVGKYEFIIPQAICGEAIQSMPYECFPKAGEIYDAISFLEELQPDLADQLQTSNGFTSIKQQESANRYQQVFLSEMNCVFDSWNEQIIISKSEIAGFSGIGLNEGSLALLDQNKEVPSSSVLEYVDRAKQKILSIINDDPKLGLNKRIEKMAKEDICTNEGAWVCYTDEGLGFVLELDFVIFEELMVEVAKWVHRRTIFNAV